MGNVLKKNIYGILLVLIAGVLISYIDRTGWLDALDNAYYDYWHQLAGPRYAPSNVVIVAVDDMSLLDYKDEPLAFWGPYFARAVSVLRNVGVKTIGIDFMFSVSSESWLRKMDIVQNERSRTFDAPMREQLNSGQVILIGNVVQNKQGESEILLPVIDYVYSLPNAHKDIGLANLYFDKDDVIRNYSRAVFSDNIFPRLTFSALLATRSCGLDPEAAFWDIGNRRIKNIPQPQTIGFVGPPGTFERISFRRLLEKNAEDDPDIKGLRDRIIIIAAENSGSYDTHLTPYVRRFFSYGSVMMSGAEIHANIIETMLTGKYPETVHDSLRVMWIMGVLCLGTFLFFKLKPVHGLMAFFLLCIVCAGISCLFFLNYRILHAGSIQTGLLFTYMGSLGMRFSRKEREKAHLESVFAPYVSESVVRKIMSGGKLPDLGGETMEVTVLFSDIRKFTTISEKLEPSEVVEMLNRYYNLACEPILEHGGIIDKFIGDAVMAIFGAPAPYSDHAERTIKAALEMLEIANDFQKWLKERFPDRDIPDFNIGIGIHTGRAVIGNIGSEKRMGYTAIGDAVNIASRLESLTKKTGWPIVASLASINAAGSMVITGREDDITPSGRSGIIHIFEVLGTSDENGSREI